MRARALVRLQSRDRVIEIGVASDVVLGACSQQEGEVEAEDSLGRGRDPLGRVLEFVQLPGGVVVLDRSADGARLGSADNCVAAAAGSAP